MTTEPFTLNRFVVAQAPVYTLVVRELQNGKKESHWIWFVFPQLEGLGVSRLSRFYGISGVAEARSYMAHPLLGSRLCECIKLLLHHRGKPIVMILGEVDAMKLHSCLTLFIEAVPSIVILGEALDAFYAGRSDLETLRLLREQERA